MQYIFEYFGYICCVGEVSALDGENIDIFKNLGVSLAQINVTPNYRSTSYNSSFSQLVPALLSPGLCLFGMTWLCHWIIGYVIALFYLEMRLRMCH